MATKGKGNRWIGWALVALIALALGALFLPLLSTKDISGNSISFFGWPVIFGGNVEASTSSGTYAFTFNINIALLVLTQCFLLSGVSCALGGQSVFNRVFALVFSSVCLAGLCMTPWLVSLFSPIPFDGLSLGYGGWVSFALSALVIIGEIAWIVMTKKPSKNDKKSAEIKDS
ncbi:MAG: hypothetical protein K6E59_03425 [Bacilli bacterium]|nr:hypothetical protein [Bacilli bacterium]